MKAEGLTKPARKGTAVPIVAVHLPPRAVSEVAGPVKGTAVPVVTTVGEALGIPDHGMRVIDLKIALVEAIRARRKAAGMSQAALAKRMGVSQPRIAEMERHEPSVTLDTLFAAHFAVCGSGPELGAVGVHLDALAGV